MLRWPAGQYWRSISHLASLLAPWSGWYLWSQAAGRGVGRVMSDGACVTCSRRLSNPIAQDIGCEAAFLAVPRGAFVRGLCAVPSSTPGGIGEPKNALWLDTV